MFTKILKIEMIENEIKLQDLAKKINTSPQNLSQKMKRDNFSEKEMQEIAEALGKTLSITLQE